MKRLLSTILPLIAFVAFVGATALSADATVLAACDTANMSIQTGADCAQGTGQPTDLFAGEESVFGRVTNILLFIVGAIAVIMLIIGGIRYVVSGGDQNQVTAAKRVSLSWN